MSRVYVALDLNWHSSPSEDRVDLVLAELDDLEPLAVEEHDFSTRIFFSSADARDRARVKLGSAADFETAAVDVSDDDWAARSQASIGAVRVGRLVIAPPWATEGDGGVIVIQPSMGFGTGHHATTRLCLQMLQQQDVAGASVLDVGTGSGVLAIAAAKLGAARVVAIDNDPDALQNARENLTLNEVEAQVQLRHMNFGVQLHDRFDLLLANLTGATLVRLVQQLSAALTPGGALIASGYGVLEEADVAAAFAAQGLVASSRDEEDAWVCARFTASPRRSTTS